ncbi:hypothetical protein [Nocardioides sp. CER19]|uniref:hypothetical protein n=1 Tax=Nocardioides sp. CER19 TaxID=3038538 RepID=UPI002446CCBE|nr:hypothetical protein [Nocardioides sp. CER19]MDH2416578.1 hypothetical protein [Nocardioides sp. CER19]
MTGRLRALLDERVNALSFAPPDLPRIVAEAGLRARRRRLRALTATAAGLAVVAVTVGGAALVGRARHDGAEVATGGGIADPVTWSRGSVIHVGPDRIDVGFTVHGFVRTSSGFAVMDGHRSVWSVTDAGQHRVGEVGDQQRLVADRNGTLVAWIGPDRELVVYDQLTARTRGFPDARGATAGGGVLALDRRTVYWRNSGGVVAVDVDTGAVTAVAGSWLQLYDAKNSMLAFTDGTGDLKVGSSVAGAATLATWSADPHHGDEPVVLSPSGRWTAVAHIHVADSGDDHEIESRLIVYDDRTAETTTLRLPGGPWVAVPSVWLGDATLQVLGLFGNPPFTGDTVDPSLFRCTLPKGSCVRVVRVGRVGASSGIATLPDGDWTSGD